MNLTGEETVELRSIVLRCAGESLTPAQFRCFVLYFFADWSENQIAEKYGVNQVSVHQALWGQRKQAGAAPIGGGVKRIKAALEATKGGGAMSNKLGKSLEEDPELTDIILKLKEPPKEPEATTLSPIGWFAGTRPEFFASMGVLLVACHLADKKKTVSVTRLAEQVPRFTLSHAMTQLRVLGFISTDGVTIHILKTPQEPTDA